MDLGKLPGKIPQILSKYRYPLVILLAGLVLLTLPGRKQTEESTERKPIAVATMPDTTQQLTEILGQIRGVGKVKVMLTVAVGESVKYQMDEKSTTGEQSSSVDQQTVVITDSERNQQALVEQKLPPVYRGAIIVCQGADSPSVKLAVVEAVSKVTGLGAGQISVVKMK